MRALARTEHAVSEYLVAEVLSAQPSSRREFLLCTSICERFDGALADELTGGTDGDADRSPRSSATMCSSSSTPTAAGTATTASSRSSFEPSSSAASRGGVRELHRRAARCLADSGDQLEALRHALAAKDAVIADRARLRSSGWRSTAAATTGSPRRSSSSSLRP